MKFFLPIMIILVGVVPVLGQNNVRIDSLERIFNQSNDDTARAHLQIRIVYEFIKFNYAEALKHARLANEIATTANSTKFIAKSYHSMAAVYFGMSDYKNASTNYFNALRHYEQASDTSGIIAMNVNLGAVHDRLHDIDKALGYYHKAQDWIQVFSRKNPQVLSTIYNNIGNTYQTKGEFATAKEYYEKALAIAEQGKDRSITGVACNNLGKLYLYDLKDNEKAIYYLQKGLKVRQDQGDKGEMARSLTFIAHYHRNRGDLKQAREAINQAIAFGEEVGSLEAQKFAYHTLFTIDEAAGNTAEALENFKIFKELNDSIQNQLAGSEITRLQLQYDFEKAERQREQERNETRFTYTVTIIILSTGLVVAILIVIIIRSRARQTELKRRNLAQDMEIKNKELTTNVMYLFRKNELINNVAERLLNVQQTFQPENQKIIREIIVDLQKEADNDAWKEFELRFNQVHSDFYVKLRSLYPGLSPAEEKLCAFLRLNMSSKEIAAITQQSVKSVEVARARLRKKLNLTNTSSNLVSHLAGI